jgi:hypothetical protein
MGYQLIETLENNTSGVISMTVSAIPQDGIDLIVHLSTRRTSTSTNLELKPNGIAGGTGVALQGDGSSASSLAAWQSLQTPSSATANTFASVQYYIPNYTGSQSKVYSIDLVTENNATLAYQRIQAVSTTITAAITSLTIEALFAVGTTLSVYKITAD